MSDPNKGYDYDEVAQNVFFPAFADIAEFALEHSGKRAGRMLDIGCGGGHLGFTVLQKSDFSGVGVDINDEAIEIANNRAQEWGLADRVRIVKADVVAMPFSDGEFDLIVSRGSIPAWQDVPAAFAEIWRVLAPGGYAQIGCGLGREETRERIMAKLQERKSGMFGPGHDKKFPSKSEYEQIFADLGISDYEFNYDIGNWAIIRKPA